MSKEEYVQWLERFAKREVSRYKAAKEEEGKSIAAQKVVEEYEKSNSVK